MNENEIRAYMPKSLATNWATPRSVFDPLNQEFKFDLDVCAEPWNAKSATFYTVEQDGLKQPWNGACWCNPPYGARNITQWLAKGQAELVCGNASVVVYLLPNTTDVVWFHTYVWDDKKHATRPGIGLRFIKGRVIFDPPPSYTGDNPGNVKGSIVVVMRLGNAT